MPVLFTATWDSESKETTVDLIRKPTATPPFKLNLTEDPPSDIDKLAAANYLDRYWRTVTQVVYSILKLKDTQSFDSKRVTEARDVLSKMGLSTAAISTCTPLIAPSRREELIKVFGL